MSDNTHIHTHTHTHTHSQNLTSYVSDNTHTHTHTHTHAQINQRTYYYCSKECIVGNRWTWRPPKEVQHTAPSYSHPRCSSAGSPSHCLDILSLRSVLACRHIQRIEKLLNTHCQKNTHTQTLMYLTST